MEWKCFVACVSSPRSEHWRKCSGGFCCKLLRTVLLGISSAFQLLVLISWNEYKLIEEKWNYHFDFFASIQAGIAALEEVVSSDRTPPSAYAFDVPLQWSRASDRCQVRNNERGDRVNFCDCAHAISATPVAPSNLPHVQNACYSAIQCRYTSAVGKEERVRLKCRMPITIETCVVNSLVLWALCETPFAAIILHISLLFFVASCNSWKIDWRWSLLIVSIIFQRGNVKFVFYQMLNCCSPAIFRWRSHTTRHAT